MLKNSKDMSQKLNLGTMLDLREICKDMLQNSEDMSQKLNLGTLLTFRKSFKDLSGLKSCVGTT